MRLSYSARDLRREINRPQVGTAKESRYKSQPNLGPQKGPKKQILKHEQYEKQVWDPCEKETI